VTRAGAAAVPPAILLLALPLLGPLGVLRGPFLLVVALPILARALAAIGWIELAARPFARVGSAIGAVLSTYVAWLGLSALLTLDVAAVVAVPVGLEVAARAGRGGRAQVASAIVGSNVGSMLFPFSNLTNLVLVAGTGLAFVDFVRVAWIPQLLAALGAGVVLALRARELDQDREAVIGEAVIGEADEAAAQEAVRRSAEARGVRPATVLAGIVSVVGALGAVAAGLAGSDVATVLGLTAAIVATIAVAAGAVRLGDLARAVSLPACAVILAAAALAGPIVAFGQALPDPDTTLAPAIALPLIALVGGALAATVNNLPAAAFGAVWLSGASPAAILAYLIGTNVLALVTPHGSVATMLGRTLAHRGGSPVGTRSYLRRAWRYAVVGAVPAIAWLVVVR
jgi:arsenical pump membrane protein